MRPGAQQTKSHVGQVLSEHSLHVVELQEHPQTDKCACTRHRNLLCSCMKRCICILCALWKCMPHHVLFPSCFAEDLGLAEGFIKAQAMFYMLRNRAHVYGCSIHGTPSISEKRLYRHSLHLHHFVCFCIACTMLLLCILHVFAMHV